METALRWLKRFAAAMALVVLLVVVALTALVFPYVRDDVVLDRIVRAVALDWRDHGEVRARGRLAHELDQRRIGLQVSDDNCTLEARAEEKVVHCAWAVEVEIPFLPRGLPLSFRSVATVDATGDVH